MSVDIAVCMRVFTAVVEAGSFAGAAVKLDLSRAMTTRYLAQLEAHLGVRLLNRTTRKLSLTEAGGDYCQRAIDVLALIDEAGRAAAQEAALPRGTLRVASSIGFGVGHLDRAVAAYLQLYPDVEVDLTLNERKVDLVEEGFDLAIRIATQIDPGLVARRLARVRTVVCAAPAYLRKHGTPKSPSDLAQHNCLTFAHASFQNEWRFRRGDEQQVVRIAGNLRSSSGAIAVGAAMAGLGVILEPAFLPYEALRRKQLVRILADWATPEFSLFAVYPSRRFLPPKVRSFIDFLVQRFAAEPYWDVLPPGTGAG